MDGPAAAQVVFIIGACVPILAGLMHMAMTLFDTRRPTFMAPTSDPVRGQMNRTGVRFKELFPGKPSTKKSLWRAWLGFNLSHGLGLTAFGVVALLLGAHDFGFVTDTGFLLPVAAGISAVYVAVSLAYFFYAPTILLGLATACFILAWALA